MAETNVSLPALYSVNSALNKFRTDTERLDASVSKHIREILNLCEDEIRNVQDELSSLYQDEKVAIDEINCCLSKISELEGKIKQCEITLSALRSKTPIDEQDRARITGEIKSREAELSKYRSDLEEAEDKLEEAQGHLSEIRDIIAKKENKLSAMKTGYTTVHAELSILGAEITKFCRYSDEQNGSNISSVNLCIKYLEEYIYNNL